MNRESLKRFSGRFRFSICSKDSFLLVVGLYHLYVGIGLAKLEHVTLGGTFPSRMVPFVFDIPILVGGSEKNMKNPSIIIDICLNYLYL